MKQSYNSMNKMYKANKAAENDLGNPMGTMADKAREYLAGKDMTKKTNDLGSKNRRAGRNKGLQSELTGPKQYKNNREKTNADYESMYKKVGIANKKSTNDLDYERDM